MADSTIFYFSGVGCKIENFILKRPEPYKNCGVLLSYWELRKSKMMAGRLATLTGKENQK